jgi:hypothetical protein
MQTPQKGQPIDYQYILEIVKAINDLQSQSYTVSSIYNGTKTNSTINTKDVVIYTGYQLCTNKNASDVTSSQSFTHNFSETGFLENPVITITPVLEGTGSRPEDVTVGIVSSGTTSVTFNVKFNTKDNPSVGVNIIAIGKAVKV